MANGIDRMSPSPGARVEEARDRWWLVAAAGLALFVGWVDMSIINVTLPIIERDLEILTI